MTGGVILVVDADFKPLGLIDAAAVTRALQDPRFTLEKPAAAQRPGEEICTFEWVTLTRTRDGKTARCLRAHGSPVGLTSFVELVDTTLMVGRTRHVIRPAHFKAFA